MEVAGRQQAQEVEVIEPSQLNNLLTNLESPGMSENERLAMVLLFCTFHIFTADKAAAILTRFGAGDERASAAAYLFTRCGVRCPLIQALRFSFIFKESVFLQGVHIFQLQPLGLVLDIFLSFLPSHFQVFGGERASDSIR